LQTPVHTIATNAGVEGAVVVGKLLEQDNTDLGYDAAKGRLLNRFLTNYLTLVLVQASYGMCDHLPQVNMLTW
jgi:hypothetical protein